ncbi:hypothetical protein TNCV_892071 [Trichonephila clavipes]|nr:hypothetical protein TNCV_892071 [Trichonephila clavipes]
MLPPAKLGFGPQDGSHKGIENQFWQQMIGFGPPIVMGMYVKPLIHCNCDSGRHGKTEGKTMKRENVRFSHIVPQLTSRAATASFSFILP